MSNRRYRVLAVTSHPVQYMSPIYRRMAGHPRLELKVAYCTLRGAQEGYDPEFEANVKWDVPLLDGYDWVHVPNKGSGDESFWGLNNPGLWSLIRGGNFDAVLGFPGYRRFSFWIAWLRSRLSGAAFLSGTDAASLESRDGSSLKPLVKRVFWPILYRLATQVIVPSTATKELMLSLGLPPERVTVTPYSVDNDWWFAKSAEVKPAKVRESWGIPPDGMVILFCAKLQVWKRPMDLLRAFAEAKIEQGFLVFAGSGPHQQELERAAGSLGIEGRVRFLGFMNQTQLPGVYTSADLMVLPSEYEPFAVVVNEAYCCGCPVVVSDRVGAGRDLVKPVDPRMIYRVGDISQLAGLLRELAGDSRRLEGLKSAVRDRIRVWSPEANVSAVVDALDAIEGRRR